MKIKKYILRINIYFLFILWGISSLSAQELLPHKMLVKEIQTLAGWDIYGYQGGRIQFVDKRQLDKGVRLTTTRIKPVAGKDVWSACLQKGGKPLELTPGIKYKFTVEARGNTSITLGVFELPWKYSAEIVSAPSKLVTDISKTWKKYSFEYTPSSDMVVAERPFVLITGWQKFLEIRSFSFMQEKAVGSIKVKAVHFMTSPGGELDLEITSSAYPVKLLLYGPDGTSGEGGDNGGSSAWCDHFKKAIQIDGDVGNTTKYKLSIPVDSVEGSYRLVVVNKGGNATANISFTVRPKEYAENIIDMVNNTKLKNGSRIVFIGDSLTDLFRGRNYVSLIERALKWKYGNNIEVINAGKSGDNIKKIKARLERDVISRNPTHIFIFEGANDIKRRYDVKTNSLRGWALPQPEYEKIYREVVKELKDKTKAEIIIATCAPVDQNVTKMFQDKSKDFAMTSNFYGTPDAEKEVVLIQKKIAEDNNLVCVDSNAELNKYIKDNNDKKAKQFLTVDDGVHLSEYGNREMARIVLKYLSELKE